MAVTAEQLARLRVAIATGRLPRDLGESLLRELTRGLVAERRARRNELLHEAARRLGGSRWSNAATLYGWLSDLRKGPGLERLWQPEDSAEYALCKAWKLDPDQPGTVRQLLRILASDIGRS